MRSDASRRRVAAEFHGNGSGPPPDIEAEMTLSSHGGVYGRALCTERRVTRAGMRPAHPSYRRRREPGYSRRTATSRRPCLVRASGCTYTGEDIEGDRAAPRKA